MRTLLTPPVLPLLASVLALPSARMPAQDPGVTEARRSALERAAEDLPSPGATLQDALGAQRGPVRLIDISLDVLGAGGASTERDPVLADLQGGGHDPRKRGITIQNVELSLTGAVDPWFEAEAHLITFLDPIEGETVVELEEAFATTRQLPAGLQLKMGTFFTEFGRLNAQHPHAWDWLDQPVINTRLFGPDGMRGPGARLAWLVPTDAYVEVLLGLHNASGETMASFLANDELYAERPIGGRFFAEREVRSAGDLVYTLRAATSLDVASTSTLGFGASALFGPNATGGDADTLIYGADFVFRWRPESSRRGWPFVKIQGEASARAFDAAEQVDEADPLAPVTLPARTLDDYGICLQGLYGFADGFAAGLRVDWVSGAGDSYDAGAQAFDRAADPFRADRVRVSPLLAWHASEFSRFRLQYNFDDSDHLDGPAHSVWLGFEVLIGAHPVHSY